MEETKKETVLKQVNTFDEFVNAIIKVRTQLRRNHCEVKTFKVTYDKWTVRYKKDNILYELNIEIRS